MKRECLTAKNLSLSSRAGVAPDPLRTRYQGSAKEAGTGGLSPHHLDASVEDSIRIDQGELHREDQ